MSDIPAPDYRSICDKYALRNAELQFQIYQLESIIGALRAERDEATRMLTEPKPTNEPDETPDNATKDH